MSAPPPSSSAVYGPGEAMGFTSIKHLTVQAYGGIRSMKYNELPEKSICWGYMHPTFELLIGATSVYDLSTRSKA